MSILEPYFAPQGALASLVDGYQPREGQQQLAEAVFNTLNADSVLLAEAGTGTGKTFAYLLPILLSGKKALVSTATKTLQEQIFSSDLPLVRKLLASPAKVALLKGRSNYFCHYHYGKWQESGANSPIERAQRRRVETFIDRSLDGDLVALELAEDDPVRQRISSTADNCLGRDCEFFEECFVQKARQKAKEADVVVVNHHLLLADFALKSDGFAEILPDIDAFIIDEAHHLPQTAVNFLGERFSSRQVQLFLEELQAAQLADAPDALELQKQIALSHQGLNQLLSELKNQVGLFGEQQSGRVSAGNQYYDGEELRGLNVFWTALQALAECLAALDASLSPHHERSKVLAALAERLGELRSLLIRFLDEFHHDKAASDENEEDNALTDTAQWLDVGQRSFVLNAVPVNAASKFAQWISQSQAGWCFLSATLAVDNKFDHFRRELGLGQNVQTLLLGSPFNYRLQSLLYHPPQLPPPNAEHYTAALMQAALPVLKRSKGRAFCLFTSYRAMHEAKACLEDEDFTLFVQGEMPKTQLLSEFRRSERGVLLATASFWEGVDVRGDRLVCVVIDKLPFAAPNDPVTKTRHRLLEEKGLSPFIHDSLPQAVITLKQGVGRLIRDSADYGVLLIGDPRLTGKGYGKIFLDSLPRMTRTTDLSIVDRFFTYHEPSS